jgi:hypothetical protein
MRGVTSSFSDVQAAFQWMANSGKWLIIGQENTFDKINADGLVLYVDAGKLNSYPTTGSIWRDLSGNSAYVTLYNNPVFNSQSYIDFDGTDDYGIVTGASLSNTAYTKIAWFKPDVATANIISGGGDSQHAFWMAATNYLNAGHNGSWSTVQYTGQSLPGRWWMGAVTFNTTTGWVLYLNGNIVDTDPSTATFTGGNVIRIAAFNDAQNLFNGKISQAQVYNRVLSESEIKQNYYGGDIVTNGLVFALDAGNLVSYESGSTTTYSLTGSLSSSLINGVGYNQNNGGTWNFDGTNDYIDCNSSVVDLNSSFTFASWVKTPANLSNNSGFRRLIGRGDNSSAFTGEWAATSYNTSGNAFAFEIDDDAIKSGMYGTIILNPNTWYYVVGVADRTNTLYLYVNGILDSTAPDNTSLNINPPYNLYLGSQRSGGNPSFFLNGNLPVVQIYNRALTAAEVAQNFNAQRQRFGV